MLTEFPADLQWLLPWEPVIEHRESLVRELKKELTADHVLHGLNVAAIAHRIDCDDVLFATSDDSKPLAVVHLTWTSHTESAECSFTTLYEDWQDWVARCLIPDHREYSGEGD